MDSIANLPIYHNIQQKPLRVNGLYIWMHSPFLLSHILLFYAWVNRRRLGVFSLILAYSEVFCGYSYANETLDIDNSD